MPDALSPFDDFSELFDDNKSIFEKIFSKAATMDEQIFQFPGEVSSARMPTPELPNNQTIDEANFVIRFPEENEQNFINAENKLNFDLKTEVNGSKDLFNINATELINNVQQKELKLDQPQGKEYGKIEVFEGGDLENITNRQNGMTINPPKISNEERAENILNVDVPQNKVETGVFNIDVPQNKVETGVANLEAIKNEMKPETLVVEDNNLQIKQNVLKFENLDQGNIQDTNQKFFLPREQGEQLTKIIEGMPIPKEDFDMGADQIRFPELPHTAPQTNIPVNVDNSGKFLTQKNQEIEKQNTQVLQNKEPQVVSLARGTRFEIALDDEGRGRITVI